MSNLLAFQLESGDKKSILTLCSPMIEAIEKELRLKTVETKELHGAPAYVFEGQGLVHFQKYHRLDNGMIVAFKRIKNNSLLPDEQHSRLVALNAYNSLLPPVNLSYLRIAGIGKGVSIELAPIADEQIKYITDGYYYGTVLFYKLLKQNLELKKRG